MKTTMQTVLIEPTVQNIEKSFDQIKAYAANKGCQLKGNLQLPTKMLGGTKAPQFESKRQKKAIAWYLTRIDQKPGMRLINTYLNFLFKRVYKLTDVPFMEYSDKELKIKQARKAWKAAATEAERLRLAYRAEKGSFYK